MKNIYHNILIDAEAGLRSKYPDLNVSTILREGHPSTTTVDSAENDGFDLIVIGSHGIRGIKSWMLRSTSHRVVDYCTKPILIVK